MGHNPYDSDYRAWLIAMFLLEGLLMLGAGFAEAPVVRGFAAIVGLLWLLAIAVVVFHRLGDLSKLPVALRHFETWRCKRGLVKPDGSLEWSHVTHRNRPAWRAFVGDWGSVVYIFQDTGDIYLQAS